MKRITCLLILLLFNGLGEFPAYAATVRSANTEVELISEVDAIVPQRPFWVALRMKMDDHWHTYWKNPGDSGLPLTIQWDLPPGFSASEIYWPYPKRLDEAGLTTYGFEGEVFLLTRIDPPAILSHGDRKQIKAKVDFLACELICVPGSAEVSLVLPVDFQGNRWSDILIKPREKLPISSSPWMVAAKSYKDQIVVYLTIPKSSFYSLSNIQFFTEEKRSIEDAAVQVQSQIAKGYRLVLKKSHLKKDVLKTLKGVLVVREGWRGRNSERALSIDIPIEPVASAALLREGDSSVAFNQDINILGALIFAFIGGLILNLMPCVLPVLSLKVMGLIEHKDDKVAAWKNGVAFAFGVVVSFWILAGCLILLRAAGQQIGWGFQFQSPTFLIFLSTLLFMFGLNLFGVYEIGTSLTTVEGKIPKRKDGSRNAFLLGILATVAATPCTAPFMGTALGFALTQPPLVSMGVFTSLGLGMAFPYLILARFPQLLKFVPKPGPWMIVLKRIMGGLLMTTVAWLLWVFYLQIGENGLFMVVVSFMIMGMGAWIYGNSMNSKDQNSARILAILCLIGGFAIALWGTRLSSGSFRPVFINNSSGIQWKDYSPELIQSLKANHEVIFIDFTAAWCLSCQVNDRIVFQDSKVISKFKELNVVSVKADWTSRDETITRALAAYGKSSIPVYVFYGKGKSKPVFLPEIITPAIVIKALEKLK